MQKCMHKTVSILNKNIDNLGVYATIKLMFSKNLKILILKFKSAHDYYFGK